MSNFAMDYGRNPEVPTKADDVDDMSVVDITELTDALSILKDIVQTDRPGLDLTRYQEIIDKYEQE